MSDQEDFSKPVNVSNNLFANLDLPKQNLVRFGKKQQIVQIIDKPQANSGNNKRNLYQMNQDEDEEVFQINLQQKIKTQQISKQPFSNDLKSRHNQKSQKAGESTSNSSAGSYSTPPIQIKNAPHIVNKRHKKTINRNSKNNKKTIKDNKQVDIEAEIGEVGQWAQKGMNIQNSEESDFDNHYNQDVFDQSQKMDKLKNDEIRKRIEQKVKNMESNSKKQDKGFGGGLAAKAEQLKRKKQAEQQFKANKQNQQQTSKHNLLVTNKVQKKQQSPEYFNNQQNKSEDEQDDPWERVNQQTKKQYQQKIQKVITKQDVLEYYKNTYQIIQEDLIHQIEFQDDDQQSIGCWQALFSCFKEDNKQDKSQKENKFDRNKKNKVGMRLLAISKARLVNTQQQFFILKFIWDKLTKQKFIRYGNHWNQIGFQGRDPESDLRSTGVLSLLQWFQFIDQNQKLSKQIHAMSIQKQIPQALTFIKLTGLFLTLLKCGKISDKSSNKQNNWNQYQNIYNSLAYKAFKKLKQKQKQQINIGERLDAIIQNIRKTFNRKSIIKQYEANLKSGLENAD